MFHTCVSNSNLSWMATYTKRLDLRRAVMINHRDPGPWIDVAGPTTLTVIVMATIIAQFCAKLHSMMYE